MVCVRGGTPHRRILLFCKIVYILNPGGHSIVKNTGGWLDSLGSGILVGKDILGFYKNIDLDNS